MLSYFVFSHCMFQDLSLGDNDNFHTYYHTRWLWWFICLRVKQIQNSNDVFQAVLFRSPSAVVSVTLYHYEV